jgi:hypothetical protein
MGETIIICLRDLRPHRGACKMFIDLKESEPDGCIKDTDKIFLNFVKQAQKYKIRRKDIDVYIGIWASQVCFTLPKKFSDLISSTSWKVTIDFND